MIAYPAIDLRGGRVVQLVGGRPETERVSLPDAVAVASRWVAAGFRALHVIDLDAALGAGSNGAHIERLLRAVRVPTQVGGGVRDDARVEALLAAGAARVIVGTRAVQDRAWLERMAGRLPGRVVVAADVRDSIVVTHGWTALSALRIEEWLGDLDTLPLAAVLVTDVTREGRMEGIDGRLFERVCAATRHPLLAAGGITSLDDLRALDNGGAAGAVLGMALYTGALDAETVAREFET